MSSCYSIGNVCHHGGGINSSGEFCLAIVYPASPACPFTGPTPLLSAPSLVSPACSILLVTQRFTFSLLFSRVLFLLFYQALSVCPLHLFLLMAVQCVTCPAWCTRLGNKLSAYFSYHNSIFIIIIVCPTSPACLFTCLLTGQYCILSALFAPSYLSL